MLQLKTDHGDVFKVSGFGTIYDDFPLLEEDVVKQRIVIVFSKSCGHFPTEKDLVQLSNEKNPLV